MVGLDHLTVVPDDGDTTEDSADDSDVQPNYGVLDA